MKMKALSVFILISLVLVFTNCNRDHDLAESPDVTLNEATAWKPSDGMSPFLSAETRAQMPAEDLEFVDRILRNPNEDILRTRGAEVHIPAGSTDVLQDVIDAAYPGDVIVLDAGDHMESGQLSINKPISLFGEAGAILTFGNVPGSADFNFIAAIQINEGGSGTIIKKVDFRTAEPIGGTAIFVNEANQVKILQNIFSNWQAGVFGHKCERLIITQNTIHASTAWQTGAIGESHGIVLADGAYNSIVLNLITGGLDGIFTGGMKGIDFSNTTNNCFLGQIVCHLPDGEYSVNGVVVDVEMPTNNWTIKYNKASDNVGFGYLVIDGSFSNFMYANNASGNGFYDIELAGDSNRFGFFTPTSHDNTVFAFHWLKVKDCGENNRVYGVKLVNNNLDPCN